MEKNYKTKFNTGDEVYVLLNNKVVKQRIKKIRISFSNKNDLLERLF